LVERGAKAMRDHSPRLYIEGLPVSFGPPPRPPPKGSRP
jgi:hypothetical protein